MSSRKLITVFGATDQQHVGVTVRGKNLIMDTPSIGNQGGAVARSLLKNERFSVRAITRNPNSDAAKTLVSLGADVVKADGFNRDEMKAAFSGSWGAFVNTQSEDPSVTQPGGPNDFDLGKNIINAAAEAGVQNLVYSSGADTESLTNGKVCCRMMMNKNKTLKYAKTLEGLINIVSVDCGWYLEGFLSQELASALGGFPLIQDKEGYLTLNVPRWGNSPERVPLTAVAEDYGHIVHGVFLDPERYNGRLVQAVSDIKSFEEIAQTFTRVTGKKARFKCMDSAEDFPTYGQAALEDVRDMFRFLQMAQGRYFDGNETEKETARALKAEALTIMSAAEDPALTNLEKYFKLRFC